MSTMSWAPSSLGWPIVRRAPRTKPLTVNPTYRITLGALADAIAGFRESRRTGLLPDMSRPFARALYATYVILPPDRRVRLCPRAEVDRRGELAEALKSAALRTDLPVPHPAGNHPRPALSRHEGREIHRRRGRGRDPASSRPGRRRHEYRVTGREFRVVDIPPGYTHAIENVGGGDLVVLFWANQPFDPEHPDTFAAKI